MALLIFYIAIVPLELRTKHDSQRSALVSASRDFDHKRVLLLAGGHFINDSYSGYLAPLLPFLMAEMKISLAAAGVLAMSIFVTAGATAALFFGIGSLGGLAGGHLSDYFTRARVMQVPTAAAVPALLGSFYLEGVFRFVCLMIGGVALYFSLPLNVVMAQELFPRQAGTVAALMIGFAYGVGGLSLAPLGLAAEHFGLKTTLMWLALLTSLAAAAAFLLNDDKDGVNATLAALGT